MLIVACCPRMTNKSRRLLDRSCAWIKEHWNACNLDVPDEFLLQWIYQTDDENEDPSGFHLAVFSFGYLQHDIVAHNVPPGVERSFSVEELLEHFQKWQMKLALAEIHRRTDMRVKPMPLFGFSGEERVEVWFANALPAR